MTKRRSRQSVMTHVWFVLVLSAMVIAIFQYNLKPVNDAIVAAAKSAVGLAIALAGIMAVWLGLVKIIEQAGFMLRIARLLSPVMRRLFPGIPAGHPAYSAMTLSFSANLLGLGNAATPFGLKAMGYLHDLNGRRTTASDAMCLFLAITTSGLALLPTGVISVRMIAGSADPAGILVPTLLSTATATIVAVLSCFLLRRWFKGDAPPVEAADVESETERSAVGPESSLAEVIEEKPPVAWKRWVGVAFFAISLAGIVYQTLVLTPPERIKICLRGEGATSSQLQTFTQCATGKPGVQCLQSALGRVPTATEASCLSDSVMNLLSTTWLIPLLLMWFVLYGWSRNVDIYAVMVDGMREGLQIIVYIVPFLLSIFLAMAMFRASGAMEGLTSIYGSVMEAVGLPPEWIPAEVLPIALTRPLSGSGASALMMELVNQEPNSFPAFVASVMAGSTDTTFYILAVYFGSVGVVKVRYAVVAGLLADFAGLLAAVTFSHVFYA